MGFEPPLHLVIELSFWALDNWAMEALLERDWAFVIMFIRAVKYLKNQILGKIKLPGFPMLSSHCALVNTFMGKTRAPEALILP